MPLLKKLKKAKLYKEHFKYAFKAIWIVQIFLCVYLFMLLNVSTLLRRPVKLPICMPLSVRELDLNLTIFTSLILKLPDNLLKIISKIVNNLSEQ